MMKLHNMLATFFLFSILFTSISYGATTTLVESECKTRLLTFLGSQLSPFLSDIADKIEEEINSIIEEQGYVHASFERIDFNDKVTFRLIFDNQSDYNDFIKLFQTLKAHLSVNRKSSTGNTASTPNTNDSYSTNDNSSRPGNLWVNILNHHTEYGHWGRSDYDDFAKDNVTPVELDVDYDSAL